MRDGIASASGPNGLDTLLNCRHQGWDNLRLDSSNKLRAFKIIWGKSRTPWSPKTFCGGTPRRQWVVDLRSSPDKWLNGSIIVKTLPRKPSSPSGKTLKGVVSTYGPRMQDVPM